MEKILIKGQHFVDEKGAEVIFSGINLVCKDPQKGFVETVDENTFMWFKECGFNLLRLGLEWEGVEPSPRSYDDDYLFKISQQIKIAEKYGIYIFLDMHQDLYGRAFGNGAPEWATLSEGLNHITGEVWSDAYLISPAVQRSIDNFWDNKEVNGIGLQDYYAKMWGHVVNYMSQYNFTNIIGYDLMNEPFMGSRSQEVIGVLFGTYAQKVLHIENPGIDDISNLWFDESKKASILADMSDINLYATLTQYAARPSTEFERTILSPFYSKVAREIRKFDKTSILLLESNYFCNMGIESGIVAVIDEAGKVDEYQAYAPHGYDLVVDTNRYESYDNNRVEFIFKTHKKTAERLNIPVIVGEWGAFCGNKYTYELTKNAVTIFEKTMFGNTYWSYSHAMEMNTAPNALKRGYPMSSTCEILKYRYDYDLGKFEVDINPNGEFKLMIFHPEAANVVLVPNKHISSFNINVISENSGYITLIGCCDNSALSIVLQKNSSNK